MNNPSESPSPSTPEPRRFELSPTQIVETRHERIGRVVGEAIGAASTAWHAPGPANSVFDDVYARSIREAVLAHIDDYADDFARDRVAEAREKDAHLETQSGSLLAQAVEQITAKLSLGHITPDSQIEVIAEQPRDENGRRIPTPDTVARIKAETFAGLAAHFDQTDGTMTWNDRDLSDMMSAEALRQRRLDQGYDPDVHGVPEVDEWQGLKVGDLVEYVSEPPADSLVWLPSKAGNRGVVTELIPKGDVASACVRVDGIRGTTVPGNLKKVGPTLSEFAQSLLGPVPIYPADFDSSRVTVPESYVRDQKPQEEDTMAEDPNPLPGEADVDGLVEHVRSLFGGIILTETQARTLIESLVVQKDYHAPDWEKQNPEDVLAQVKAQLAGHQTGIDENPALDVDEYTKPAEVEYVGGAPVATGPDGIPILEDRGLSAASAVRSIGQEAGIPIEAIDRRLRQLGLIQ